MPPLTLDVRSAEDRRDLVHRGVEALAAGKVIAIPTETVYGLAASAMHEEALEALLEAKGRSSKVPITLAIRSDLEALDHAPRMSPLARRLARRCWPGPVTLVVPMGPRDESLVSRLPASVQRVVAPEGTIGLRVPAHWLVHEIMQMTLGPLLLTSANRSGEPDAVDLSQLDRTVAEQIAVIFDDGPSRYGEPSTVVHVVEDEMKILRPGVVAESTLSRLATYMVLAVCTGNTCRSPMAEALLRRKLAKRLNCNEEDLQERGVIVLSAGIAAGGGSRPSVESVEVMREMGVDLNGHVSQPVSDTLVRHADLILTMTRGHRAALLSRWPDAASRTLLLRTDETDIADPIGGSREVYRACAREIESAIDARMVDFPG